MKKNTGFIGTVGIVVSWLSLTACTTIGSVQQNEKQSFTATQPVVASHQKPKYETYVSAGHQLPITSVTTIDGKQITFDNYKSRKLIILFATWCSDSQRAMKALKSSSILQDNELQIVAIARENSIEEVEKFKTEYGLEIDMVADVDRSIYKQFASAGIPRFIMVDENNQVVKAVLAEGDKQLDLIRWK